MTKPTQQTEQLYITEGVELRYLEANKQYNLTEFINKKVFRVSDTPLTYRQINILDKDNLLGEEREDDRTWREFSAKEMIYLLIVSELKKFGLQHSSLRTLRRAFFGESTKSRIGRTATGPRASRAISEIAIGCALSQVEIILTVSADGYIAFFDPSNYAIHDALPENLPSAYIKLNFSSYVNQTVEMLKKKPLSVKLVFS